MGKATKNAASAIPGGVLLAALHDSMEHAQTLMRVCRALGKKPETRSPVDIQHIMDQTAHVPLMVHEGPAVHRDLCYVAKVITLKEMDSFRLPGDHAKSGAIFVHVMQGRVQVRTRCREPFDPVPRLHEPAGSSASASVESSTDPSGQAGGSSNVGAGSSDAASGGTAPSRPRHSRGRSKSASNDAGVSGAGSIGGGDAGGKARTSAAGGAGAAGGGLRQVLPSEEEMLRLFNSIDMDGSGAIDVSELQSVLESMGVHKSEEEVTELIQGVDKDGSGLVEFEEFKQVLESQLQPKPRSCEGQWEPLVQAGAPGPAAVAPAAAPAAADAAAAGGSGGGAGGGGGSGATMWCKTWSTGGCLGEAAVTSEGAMAMEGTVWALDESYLLVIERTDYELVRSKGFGEGLQLKLDLIQAAPVLQAALLRSDVRPLAFAASRTRLELNGVLYDQGQAADAAYLIVQGEVKLVTWVQDAGSDPAPSPLTTPTTYPNHPWDAEEPGLRTSLADAPPTPSGGARAAAVGGGSSKRNVTFKRTSMAAPRRVEVAVLGPGDLCGDAVMLGQEKHITGAVVSSQELVALKLCKREFGSLLHPADVQRLRAYVEARGAGRRGRVAHARHLGSLTASMRSSASSINEIPSDGSDDEGGAGAGRQPWWVKVGQQQALPPPPTGAQAQQQQTNTVAAGVLLPPEAVVLHPRLGLQPRQPRVSFQPSSPRASFAEAADAPAARKPRRPSLHTSLDQLPPAISESDGEGFAAGEAEEPVSPRRSSMARFLEAVARYTRSSASAADEAHPLLGSSNRPSLSSIPSGGGSTASATGAAAAGGVSPRPPLMRVPPLDIATLESAAVALQPPGDAFWPAPQASPRQSGLLGLPLQSPRINAHSSLAEFEWAVRAAPSAAAAAAAGGGGAAAAAAAVAGALAAASGARELPAVPASGASGLMSRVSWPPVESPSSASSSAAAAAAAAASGSMAEVQPRRRPASQPLQPSAQQLQPSPQWLQPSLQQQQQHPACVVPEPPSSTTLAVSAAMFAPHAVTQILAGRAEGGVGNVVIRSAVGGGGSGLDSSAPAWRIQPHPYQIQRSKVLQLPGELPSTTAPPRAGVPAHAGVAAGTASAATAAHTGDSTSLARQSLGAVPSQLAPPLSPSASASSLSSTGMAMTSATSRPVTAATVMESGGGGIVGEAWKSPRHPKQWPDFGLRPEGSTGPPGALSNQLEQELFQSSALANDSLLWHSMIHHASMATQQASTPTQHRRATSPHGDLLQYGGSMASLGAGSWPEAHAPASSASPRHPPPVPKLSVDRLVNAHQPPVNARSQLPSAPAGDLRGSPRIVAVASWGPVMEQQQERPTTSPAGARSVANGAGAVPKVCGGSKTAATKYCDEAHGQLVAPREQHKTLGGHKKSPRFAAHALQGLPSPGREGISNEASYLSGQPSYLSSQPSHLASQPSYHIPSQPSNISSSTAGVSTGASSRTSSHGTRKSLSAGSGHYSPHGREAMEREAFRMAAYMAAGDKARLASLYSKVLKGGAPGGGYIGGVPSLQQHTRLPHHHHQHNQQQQQEQEGPRDPAHAAAVATGSVQLPPARPPALSPRNSGGSSTGDGARQVAAATCMSNEMPWGSPQAATPRTPHAMAGLHADGGYSGFLTAAAARGGGPAGAFAGEERWTQSHHLQEYHHQVSRERDKSQGQRSDAQSSQSERPHTQQLGPRPATQATGRTGTPAAPTPRMGRMDG